MRDTFVRQKQPIIQRSLPRRLLRQGTIAVVDVRGAAMPSALPVECVRRRTEVAPVAKKLDVAARHT